MELAISNRRNNDLPALAAQNKPWAFAIRHTYGELPAFTKKFSPDVQKYCAHNTRKAVDNGLPSFGRIVMAYGEEGIATIIQAHMTEAIARMGEDRDIDPHDIRFISEAICESERFRTLRFPSIFGFFHLLKCGEFDIYGKVTPRKILEAFRKYAVEQQARENRLDYEKECREAEERRERWLREAEAPGSNYEAIDWDSFIREEAQKPRLQEPLPVTIANLIARLNSILFYIGECMKQRNTPPQARRHP